MARFTSAFMIALVGGVSLAQDSSSRGGLEMSPVARAVDRKVVRWRGGGQREFNTDETGPRLIAVDPLPSDWVVDAQGLHELAIVFDEPVSVPAASVLVWTVDQGQVTDFSLTYDGSVDTLRIVFDTAIRADIATIVLNYTITDEFYNELDGEIWSPAAPIMPSGNGQRGGQAVIQYHVLQGDVDRNGVVDQEDATKLLSALGSAYGEPAFDQAADLNRDGFVNVLDVGTYQLAIGEELPSTDGVPPSPLAMSPDPALGLIADFQVITLEFTEPVAPIALDTYSCFLVGGDAVPLLPMAATLAPDGLSATFEFPSVLAECDSFSVNLSNAISDASGELIEGIHPAQQLSPRVPLQPIIDPVAPITNSSSLTLSGLAPEAQSVEVTSNGGTASVPTDNGVFVHDVLLDVNAAQALHVTGVSSCGVRSAPVTVLVTHDSEGPELAVDYPMHNSVTTAATVYVGGGLLDRSFPAFPLTVMVDGAPALVQPGYGNTATFLASEVSLLADQPTLITVVATDHLGNTTEKDIVVTKVDPSAEARIELLSGDGQLGEVNTELIEPIQIQLLDQYGAALIGKTVTVRVTRGDGTLRGAIGLLCAGEQSQLLQCQTDDNGTVSMYWTLGSDAGQANNRVVATSTGVNSEVSLIASANPGMPAFIDLASGDNQRAEQSSKAAKALRVWVNDGRNGVSGVPVTYSVTRGGGTVNGYTNVVIVTDASGYAEVDYALGPDEGLQLVEADFLENAALPTVFSVQALVRENPIQRRRYNNPDLLTAFSGTVLDDSMQPIGGVECTLSVGNEPPAVTFSDQAGHYRFDGVSGSGPGRLVIDGTTASTLAGMPIDPLLLRFPSEEYSISVVPRTGNTMSAPITLPRFDATADVVYDGASDVSLTIERISGVSMTISAGSMRLSDGSVPTPENPATLSLNVLAPRPLPARAPAGVIPHLSWAMEPAGATFDPPLGVVIPNTLSLPPGSLVYTYRLIRATASFEVVGTGTVSADGLEILAELSSAGTVDARHRSTMSSKFITAFPRMDSSAAEAAYMMLGCPFRHGQTWCEGAEPGLGVSADDPWY